MLKDPMKPESHQPRKRFGQHFLTDTKIIERIVSVVAPMPDEVLVEIGAGLGALTTSILQRIPHLYVVEIDRDLSRALSDTFGKQLTIYNEDALQFDFNQIPLKANQHLRVFGNLPYNISTPLLFHLLLFAPMIHSMIFMLQKEVIDRICAKPNTHAYGRLSVMIQYACQTQQLFDIGPQAFSPPPKVQSSVICLTPYLPDERPIPLANNYRHFAETVNRAFQHRRKTLKNALKDFISPEIFEAQQIDPKRRPETLSVSEYVLLSNASINQSL